MAFESNNVENNNENNNRLSDNTNNSKLGDKEQHIPSNISVPDSTVSPEIYQQNEQ